MRELPNAQTTVRQRNEGVSTMDRCIAVVYNHTRDFISHILDVDEDQALTIMSMVDFQITQVR